MSGLVGNPEDRFSHNEAHIIVFVFQELGVLSLSACPQNLLFVFFYTVCIIPCHHSIIPFFLNIKIEVSSYTVQVKATSHCPVKTPEDS